MRLMTPQMTRLLPLLVVMAGISPAQAAYLPAPNGPAPGECPAGYDWSSETQRCVTTFPGLPPSLPVGCQPFEPCSNPSTPPQEPNNCPQGQRPNDSGQCAPFNEPNNPGNNPNNPVVNPPQPPVNPPQPPTPPTGCLAGQVWNDFLKVCLPDQNNNGGSGGGVIPPNPVSNPGTPPGGPVMPPANNNPVDVIQRDKPCVKSGANGVCFDAPQVGGTTPPATAPGQFTNQPIGTTTIPAVNAVTPPAAPAAPVVAPPAPMPPVGALPKLPNPESSECDPRFPGGCVLTPLPPVMGTTGR